ncbi:MAG: glycerol-3-phosphate dehydrogenase/oxidase [Nevskiaceae bacterium]|nr:MAG: glycerol-3-phosphate dehydrogenase/oxidase [Nevskiaceae bacterium]TAM33055.1 MAG: glycerol-3-phosphate dehydrogenase/oxidase [Nevskiaceae bacterium]
MSRLAQLPARVDLLVIGGGITGAGIFREAARAGVSVLLVEARDYASGTSSWSSKLVHGGLRYLKTGEWRLTAESVRERERLLREAPDLVQSLDFVMPLYRGIKPGKTTMRLGLWLYDRFSSGGAHSRFLPAAEASAAQPGLRAENLLGAMRYQDARTDDCRLVWRLIEQGQRDGGLALNYVVAEQLLQAQGRVCGATLRDAETGESREIAAGLVINAAGVWADALPGQPAGAPRLRPLRGSHLVFPQARLPLPQAVGWLHPRDQRPVFAYPWQGATLLGTTDLDHREELWNPRMQRAEADYLLEALDWLLPGAGLGLGDALSSYAGVRPVVDDGADKPSAASRESAQWASPGYIGVTGGKLTTFRVTARQALRAAAQQLPALRLAADAAALFDRALSESPAELPDLAQIGERVGEQVFHLDDLLLRRSRAGLVLPEGAEALIEPALAACRAQLAWDDQRCAAEAGRYREYWRRQHDPRGLG